MTIALALCKVTNRLSSVCGQFLIGKHSRLSACVLVTVVYVPLTGCAPDHGRTASKIETERNFLADTQPRTTERRRASAMFRTAKVPSAAKVSGTTKESLPTTTVFRTANTSTSPRPSSLIPIPLPDPALLIAQPEPDCESKDQQQPSQTEPQIDYVTKLDRDRTCYREAEKIARARLQLLQASVGETIKAAILGHTGN
jgi:hypothetical protein